MQLRGSRVSRQRKRLHLNRIECEKALPYSERRCGTRAGGVIREDWCWGRIE